MSFSFQKHFRNFITSVLTSSAPGTKHLKGIKFDFSKLSVVLAGTVWCRSVVGWLFCGFVVALAFLIIYTNFFLINGLTIARGIWILNLHILTQTSSDGAKTRLISAGNYHTFRRPRCDRSSKPNPGTNSEQEGDTEPSSPDKLTLAL